MRASLAAKSLAVRVNTIPQSEGLTESVDLCGLEECFDTGRSAGYLVMVFRPKLTWRKEAMRIMKYERGSELMLAQN